MSSPRDRFQQSRSEANPAEQAVGPLIAADHAAFLAGVPVAQVIQSAELLVQTLIKAYRLYQGDFFVLFCDVYVEAEAMGGQLYFPPDAPPHLMTTCSPEDLRATDPLRDGRLPMMVTASRLVKQEVGSELPVFASIKDPFSAAALACGPEAFYTLLVEDPQRAQQALHQAFQNQERYLKVLLDTGVNVILGAPMASGGILGPDHFRRFAADPIQALLAQIRANNRLAGLHICGDTEPILDQLVRFPAHFLSLESFDPAHWRTLVQDLKDGPALMGNFPTDLLLHGPPSAITEEVQREVLTLQGLPYVLSTACDVPQRCPPGHVQAFMRAARHPDNRPSPNLETRPRKAGKL